MCILHTAFTDFTVSNIFIFRDNIVMRTHILPGFDQILSLRDKKIASVKMSPLFQCRAFGEIQNDFILLHNIRSSGSLIFY